MQSHLVSWIVALGMAAAVTGCSSMESSGGTRMVDASNHQWLKRQSAIIVIVDGGARVAPFDYSPTESVKSTINDLLFILGNEALKQPGRFEERRQQIEQVIRHRVNFKQMAQRSLGAPWTRLNDTEQLKFVSLFVELIRDRVANKIDQYYDEQVFYLLEQRRGSFAEVRTNLIGPKIDTSLDFRLENHSGKWLVYDVVIDGISVVSNYRAQFNRIIHDNSYRGLMEKMKQRAHTVKSFEKTTPPIALLSMDAPESR